jgi:hypothetical protein
MNTKTIIVAAAAMLTMLAVSRNATAQAIYVLAPYTWTQMDEDNSFSPFLPIITVGDFSGFPANGGGG